MKKIKALVERINGKMVAIASDESTDRHGDSIKQDKWDFKNFRKNPVLLLSHNYNQPPVGLVKRFRVDGKKMIFEPHFHNITEQAREVRQMYEEGIMRAFSVGFMDNDKSNELLEISAVSVPANANAVVFEKSVSDSDKKEIDKWLKSFEDVEEKDNTVDMTEVFEQIKSINVRLNNIEKVGTKSKSETKLVSSALEKLNKNLSYLNRKVVKGK
jgi:hypothetical protein